MAKRKKPTYLVKGSLRGEPISEVISTNFIENYIIQTMNIPGVEIESYTEVGSDYFGEVVIKGLITKDSPFYDYYV